MADLASTSSPKCPHCHEGSQLVDASTWVKCGPGPEEWDLEVAQDEVPCGTCGGLGQVTLPHRTRLLLQADRSARRLRH
ncbi:hypothetical protein QOL99_01690 [Deinococcus sp. MIMF12]|uniref:Transcription factor zinc-finger domain-containing protein n=1 Tax=Deinococcus rhizophilus TaxID=3049544 RepID=A0ABT7JCS6_9DEIO|nr:hypothetical protein [Deinococcus rhizophilus]MDL2342853.1 hypothetical protein [Deinococcus rhizophilus]